MTGRNSRIINDVTNGQKRSHLSIGDNKMAIWIALYAGYAGIILAAIEELRMDRRLKNVEIRLGDFESKGGLCCLRG